jgi:hypothetical protein
MSSLQEENERLKRAVEELSILNDLARAIGASLNSQEIIQTIVRRSIRALNAEQGVITLVEEQGHDSMRTLVRTMVSSSEQEQYHFSQTFSDGCRSTRSRSSSTIRTTTNAFVGSSGMNQSILFSQCR